MKNILLPMRVLKPAALAALLVVAGGLLTGCLTSLHSFFNPADLELEPRLLGVWKPEEEGEKWTLSRSGDNQYAVEIRDKDGAVSKMIGKTGRLGGQLFLELTPDRKALEGAKLGEWARVGIVETHILLHVVSIEPALVFRMIDYEAFQKRVELEPEAIGFVKLGAEGEHRIVLSASTAQLQKFVLANMKKEGFWSKPSDPMKREMNVALNAPAPR